MKKLTYKQLTERVHSLENSLFNSAHEHDRTKAQLSDALETIRQNRLTIERLQEMVNQKLLVKPDMYPIGQDFREIALRLSRHLSSMPLDEMDLPNEN